MLPAANTRPTTLLRHILFLIVVSFVCTSCAALAQDRRLARDSSAGGPPQLTAADLAPWFSEPEIQQALGELNDGKGDRAIAVLTSWLASHPLDTRGPYARFAIAYAYATAENWNRAEPWVLLCTQELDSLADYCLFWAAKAAQSKGKYAEAIQFASAVDADAVFGPRARYLHAQLLLKSGDADGAVAALESFIADYPRAFYRNDVDADLAEAYTQVGAFDEAASVLYRLELLNPDTRTEREAKKKRDAILPNVSEATRERFRRTSASDSIARAEVLFNRHRSEQVIASLEPIVANLAAASREACDANYLIGRSYTKLRRHTAAAPYYDTVTDNCADADLRLNALYNGGRAHWNADNDDEAIAHFTTLYTQYPTHSYADDAMHYIALILRGQNKIKESDAVLQEQIRRWPDGDMLKDAVWIQMRALLEDGEWMQAIRYADAIGANTGEDDIYSRGRIRYFRGRSLEELSRTVEASVVYQRVIRDYPLSWYAILSFNRLNSIDPHATGRLVEELRQSAKVQTTVIVLDPPEMTADPFMNRGRALLRLGLVSLAGDEFAKLEGRYARRPGVARIVARLLDAAGVWHVSHRSGAARVTNADHYPAPDSIADWSVAYPRPFEATVTKYALERGLDPWLIYAVMREESGFQPRIESWANARGLMQLMLGTAKDMAKLTGRGDVSASQLFDPTINVELGTMFLRKLGDRFDGHPVCMIAGYNGGAGNVNAWLRARGTMPVDLWVESIPYTQTRHYAKRVAMSWWIYHWLYDEVSPVVQIPDRLPPAR